jgi:succinate dehydrogenase/fumarate reductase-like Fe-S protein
MSGLLGPLSSLAPLETLVHNTIYYQRKRITGSVAFLMQVSDAGEKKGLLELTQTLRIKQCAFNTICSRSCHKSIEAKSHPCQWAIPTT